jgi:hypothetical protein
MLINQMKILKAALEMKILKAALETRTTFRGMVVVEDEAVCKIKGEEAITSAEEEDISRVNSVDSTQDAIDVIAGFSIQHRTRDLQLMSLIGVEIHRSNHRGQIICPWRVIILNFNAKIISKNDLWNTPKTS